jgi:valyl-tRNA synthetase
MTNSYCNLIHEYEPIIKTLANVDNIIITNNANDVKKSNIVSGGSWNGLEVYVELPNNINKQQDIDQLEKKKSKVLIKQIKLETKLSNQNFIEKAPDHIIAQCWTDLDAIEDAIWDIEKTLLKAEYE